MNTGVTGAEAIAAALRAAGVDTAFGLPGVHNMALWPAFTAAGIRIVGSRHEQGCAYAADGYARSSGRLGVALVTSGPGAANTLGAVGEAWASKSPVLIIATDIPSTQRTAGVYRGALHECTDQASMFRAVTKAQTQDIHQAIYSALGAPQGPVYFEIPTDLLRADGSPPADVQVVAESEASASIEIPLGPRPMFIVGGGAKDARSQIDLAARHLGAPVITTYSARGVLPAGHPHLVPAPPHEPQVAALIEHATSAIVLGSDLDAMNTMAWKLPLPTPRVAINIDPIDATKNYAFDQVVARDARSVRQLALQLPAADPWFDDLAELRRDVRADIRSDPNTGESLMFLEHTEAALPPHSVVFADMCIAGYWLAGHFAVAETRGLHYPMGWGTLGWAFPAAIGAAASGRHSVAVMGDGGMLFAIGELATVAQEQLPITIVVVDDRGYGMLRYPNERLDGCELNAVDFVKVAEGFGVPAATVVGVGSEYRDALHDSVTRGGPSLLHVHAALYPPRTTSPRWPLK
jgi:thiamine pyrophosphate-dependent acetolactate synthase large subunit-like protein